MRRLMLTLLAATLAAFTVTSALAQSDIDLNQATAGGLAFVAQGGGNFSLGLCDNFNGARKCVGGDTVVGGAAGDGVFAGYNGFYILKGTALTTGSLNAGSCGAGLCTWTLSTAAPGYSFEFDSKKNGTGTDFLSGTLTMLSMTEVPAGKVFNETITLELVVSGGTLAQLFADNHGQVVFNVQSQTTTSLSNSPNGRGIQGILENGDLSQAPEPGTMALLGSGFLLVGGFLRRKFSA